MMLSVPAQGTDWLQYNVDARHSGNNAAEWMIGRSNVATLHVSYHVALPAIADGAPAFLANVSTATGTSDVLFLLTKDGRLLARDAATGVALGAQQAASGPRYTTSSPAVDPNRQYVYAYGLDGKVHKYTVALLVNNAAAEISSGGWPELASLKPDIEKGSSALSTAVARGGTTYLYATNGGYPGDAGDYQGHVTAINLATGAQKIFNAGCSDQTVHFVELGTPDCAQVQDAIWASGGVIYDADNDVILMATGNGTFDANNGGHGWGDSVFALHPDGTGNGDFPLDSYTPAEYQTLQYTDADLGSTAPAILPLYGTASNVPHLAVQSGKDAQLRLLNRDNLSGAGAPAYVGGELQKMAVPQGGEVLTQPAVWINFPGDGSTWVFVANGSGISGLQLVADESGNPSLVSRWTNMTGGTSPIIANDILYYASFSGMMALDPTSGAQLWNETSIGSIHRETPIVVNGNLFVTDEGAQLWAYSATGLPDRIFKNALE
jgi:hypothetical protein